MIEHMSGLTPRRRRGHARRFRGWLGLAAGLLLLPGLLAACESGDEAGAKAPSSTAPPAQSGATPAPTSDSAPTPTGADSAAPDQLPGVTASAGVTVSAQASAVGVDCHTFAMSLSAASKGLPTPRQAINAFIRSGRASFALPTTGWRGPAGAGRFTSGRATVTVVAVPGSGGFAVTSATSC
jgi:hypothetical protein